MRFKACFSYLFVLFSCGYYAFANPLSQDEALSYLSLEVRKVLEEEKKFLDVSSKRKGLSYLPPFLDTRLREEITQELKKSAPNVLVEALYLVPPATRFNMLYFYNSLLRVTQLTEVTYYNEEKKITHPLFGFSYVVDNPQTRKALEDLQLSNLQPEIQLYVYQYFLPDSPALMLYDYKYDNDQLLLKAVNCEALMLKGWTAVSPHKLFLRLVVRQTQKGYIVYAVAYARVASLFGKGEKLFTYRIKGLFDWYYQKYLN